MKVLVRKLNCHTELPTTAVVIFSSKELGVEAILMRAKVVWLTGLLKM